MQKVPQGDSIDLDVEIRNTAGSLIDPISIQGAIYRSDNSTDQTAITPNRLSTGIYRWTRTIPNDALRGIWSVEWDAILSGGLELSAEDIFEVLEYGAPFQTAIPRVDFVERGTHSVIDLIIKSGGTRVNATSVELSLTDVTGSVIATSVNPAHLSTGVYRCYVDIPYNAVPGIGVASWAAVVNTETVAIENPTEILLDPVSETDFSSGIERVAVGGTAVFDAVYLSSDGTLLDPENPEVLITDPNGVIAVDQQPPRMTQGVYRKRLPLSIPGFWKIKWSGQDESSTVQYTDVIEVVASGPGGPEIDGTHVFGATIDGVRNFIPHLLIDANTMPTIIQVSDFIDNIGSEVAFRIGEYAIQISDTGLVDRITAMAKYVVELGSAATTMDACYPAKAAPNDTSYGNILWQRYQTNLAELIQVVNDATPGPDPAVNMGSSSAAVSGPSPQFYTWMPT